MKRLIALIGIALILAGVRLYDVGVLRFVPTGELTVYGQTEYRPQDIFLPDGADCYRVDLVGKEYVQKILEDSGAVVRFREMDGNLIYAYSPRIPNSEWIHGERVNLMIYVSGERVAVGVPILKGSY